MENKNGISIFVIDDDRMLAKALKKEIENHFRKFRVSISTFDAGEHCRPELNRAPDIAIVDYHLDSRSAVAMNGMKTIDMIRKESPETEVIMFTGEDSADIAVKAMHHGAHDYVVKGENMFRKLNMAVYQCLRMRELKRDMKRQRVKTLVAVIFVSLLVGIVATIQTLKPDLL